MSANSRCFKGEVPFLPDGSIPNYVWWSDEKTCVWKENVAPFTTTLTLTDFHRGRSAASFILKDPKGATFTMTASDVFTMMQNTTITKATVTGTFGVKKVGANYSIFFIP